MKLTAEQIIEILKEKLDSVSYFAYNDSPYNITEEDNKIQNIKDEWYKNNKPPVGSSNEKEKLEWWDKYNSFPTKYDSARKRWMKENNIVWEEIEQYGGEDKGSVWYSVKYFPDHDVYLKVDGWYSSYTGAEFNGWNDVYEVKPIQKTITVYE